MLIQVDFGAAQTGIGYRFYDNAGAWVGARVTAGIAAAPQVGVYLAGATVPSGAAGVYWDCANANFTASEELSDRVLIETNLGASAGSGAYDVSVTITDQASAPLQGASVRLTEGFNTFIQVTDVDGVVHFSLDAATYRLTITKPGYTFTPANVTVTGLASFTRAITPTAIAAPADPSQATGALTTFDGQGAIAPSVTITFQLTDGPGADSYGTQSFSATSDDAGLLTAAFRRGASYKARRGFTPWIEFAVPDAGSFALPEILGTP